MLFSQLEFWYFFAAVFAFYLVLPFRAQNAMLLVASYIFYGAWDWRFLGLIAFSSLVDRGGSGKLNSRDKWIFRATAA